MKLFQTLRPQAGPSIYVDCQIYTVMWGIEAESSLIYTYIHTHTHTHTHIHTHTNTHKHSHIHIYIYTQTNN